MYPMARTISEDLIIQVLECHYCKKYISITTVPDFIGFCNINCAENWQKRIYRALIEN